MNMTLFEGIPEEQHEDFKKALTEQGFAHALEEGFVPGYGDPVLTFKLGFVMGAGNYLPFLHELLHLTWGRIHGQESQIRVYQEDQKKDTERVFVGHDGLIRQCQVSKAEAENQVGRILRLLKKHGLPIPRGYEGKL